MLSLFCAFSLARHFEISAETFTVQNFNDGDTLFIDATDKSLWIRVAPYFYFGKMTITVVQAPNSTAVIEPPAGARYFFNNVNVTIRYEQASAPTSVSVWVLEEKTICLEDSYHSRNQRSATISAGTSQGNLRFCYFLEFQKEARLTIDAPTFTPQIVIFNGLENGTVVQQKVLDANGTYPVAKMSVIQVHFVGLPVRMKVESDVFYADWSDHEGVFLSCVANISDCRAPEFDPGFQADREIVWWIWLVITGTLFVVMCFLTALLFWKAVAIDAEYSMGTGQLATVPSPYT